MLAEVNGHDEPWKFANMKFTQAQVEQALELKHTKAQEDRNLFHPDTLHKYPKIAAWLDDPDGKYADRFGDMTVKAFIAYKDNIDSRCDAQTWFAPGFSDPDKYRWDSRLFVEG